MCVTRNLIKKQSYRGAAEIACGTAVREYADQITGIEQCAIRGYADALEDDIGWKPN